MDCLLHTKAASCILLGCVSISADEVASFPKASHSGKVGTTTSGSFTAALFLTHCVWKVMETALLLQQHRAAGRRLWLNVQPPFAMVLCACWPWHCGTEAQVLILPTSSEAFPRYLDFFSSQSSMCVGC